MREIFSLVELSSKSFANIIPPSIQAVGRSKTLQTYCHKRKQMISLRHLAVSLTIFSG